jgi:hypothetical protein
MDENIHDIVGIMQVKNEKDLVAAIDLLQSQYWDIIQTYRLKRKPVIQAWRRMKERVKLMKIVLPVNYTVLVLTKKFSITGDGEVFMRKMRLRVDYTKFGDGVIGIRIFIHQTRRQKPPGVNRK